MISGPTDGHSPRRSNDFGRSPSRISSPAEGPAGQNDACSLRILIEDAVAGAFDVEAVDLRLPTRGRAQVALARQAAMYIAHVGCGLTLTEVGEMFERDRTTVAHACSIVERRRDAAEFDRAIELLELVVRVIVGAETESAVPDG